MNIHISDEAFNWYKNEFSLKDGDYVKFFVRYGGFHSLQRGFSLGISLEKPYDIGVGTKKNGVTFYVEEKDLWYFDQHDLYVNYNRIYDEPEFHYEKTS